MGLSSNELRDLAVATYKALPKKKYVDLSRDQQDYLAITMLMAEKKRVLRGGAKIGWKIKTGKSNAGKATLLFEPDNVNIVDMFTDAEVGWSHYTSNMGIEEREISMNAGDESGDQLIDLMAARRDEMYASMVEALNADFWGKPSGPSDKKPMLGLFYWLVPHITGTSDTALCDFNGGLPTGFNDVAGIDPSTLKRHRNMTGKYTNVTDEDLVLRMRKMATFTQFEAPVKSSQQALADGEDRMVLTTYDVLSGMEALLKLQNDNLGNDLAAKDGSVMFKGRPVRWVSALQTRYATAAPVLMLNWNTLIPYFLRGEDQRETPPKPSATQHRTLNMFLDSTLQLVCKDRSRNGILVKSMTGF